MKPHAAPGSACHEIVYAEHLDLTLPDMIYLEHFVCYRIAGFLLTNTSTASCDYAELREPNCCRQSVKV